MASENSVKVLLILNELDWFWSHRLPLARAILEKKWQLCLATHETSQDTRLTKMGIEAYDLPRMSRLLNPVVHLKFLWSVFNLIKTSDPDVIHAVTIRYAFYVGLVTRIIGYKPVIFTFAGLGSLFSSSTRKMRILRTVAKPILKFAFGGQGKYIIFQNPDDQQAMLQSGIISEEQSFLIRGSGIDLQAFPYVPFVDNGELPIVLFASRLLRDKGISDFIEAAKRLKDRGVVARFVVAGDLIPGNKRFISAAEIEEPHAQGIVEWLGKVSNVQQIMQEAMIIVFPSYYGEGVPKVLLEAAATGRPIITCDMPGCREIVKDEFNGILTPPRNPILLAQAIENLISDDSKRISFGKASRSLVESEFHNELVVQQTLQLYNRAISNSDKKIGS